MLLTKIEVLKLGKQLEVEPEWINLIETVKRLQFGEMRIIFKEGKPFIAENIKESIKF